MGSSLSEDEQFVIESLSSSLGGSWHPGENPPDAYLRQSNVEVAIEISTLTQYVAGNSRTLKPRLSQDRGVLHICDELNEELGGLIRSDLYVILTLHAPVDKLRKFKSILKDKITEIVNVGVFEKVSLDISGNSVKVHVVKGQRSSGKK